MRAAQVYLWGLPGSGKSRVGKILARRLESKFVDLDRKLSRELGVSVPRAFEKLGEKGFRAAEARCLRNLDLESSWVVSGGGGLPLRPANRAYMRRHGVSVCLRAPLSVIWRRLERDGLRRRPLLAKRGLQALRELAQKRKKIYDQADLQISATGSPAQIAAKIEKYLKKRRY